MRTSLRILFCGIAVAGCTRTQPQSHLTQPGVTLREEEFPGIVSAVDLGSLDKQPKAIRVINPDFPPELRNLLEHMILSHHGQLEFGWLTR